MPSFVPFQAFVENEAEKVHDLGADQLTIAITNTAPTAATNAVLADLTEITYTNLSARNLTTSSSSQTAGVYTLVVADLNLAASGGSVGPMRYFVVYNSTAAGGPLIGYYDYGSSFTLLDGEDVDLNFDQVNGVFDKQFV